MGLQVTYRLF